MQEMAIDYYEKQQTGATIGCCLLCKKQAIGCLCYDCKCTKCFWYRVQTPIGNKRKGICDLKFGNKRPIPFEKRGRKSRLYCESRKHEWANLNKKIEYSVGWKK